MKAMIKKIFCSALLIGITQIGVAQKAAPFFPEKQLTTVGVYYYPEHWDEMQWERDMQKIAAMGFEFIHLGEFAWVQMEPQEGRFDFAWLDRTVALAAKYKLKVIMSTPTAAAPVWLTRKYPETLKKRDDGTYFEHGGRHHSSFSSEVYRKYSMKIIAELAKHYGNDSRIMGWQLDNEPSSNVDYGNDALNRFRVWLKKKYSTIDNLNKAWGTSFWSGIYSDFNQINFPQKKQWGMNLHQQLDHSRFCDDETAEYLDKQAEVIRQYAPINQWITTNYIPYYDRRCVGASKNLDFISYTRYMVYGEENGIGPKGYRVGEYSSIAMANDFFRPLSPLYGVMELQPGQVNWGTSNPQPLPGAVRLWLWHVFAGGSKFNCTYRFRAPIYGFEQYHAGILGSDGVTPTSGGFEFEQYIKEIQLLRKNPHSDKVPAEYLKRKTAVLYDPDNTVAINQNKQTVAWSTEAHVLKYYKALKSFGAPVDIIRETMDFSKYPVMVMPAYQQMSRGLIAKLENYVKEGGNLVLSCRTGHQDEQGHLWQARHAAPLYPLIGAEIEFYDLLKPTAPDTIQMDSKQFAWNSWGDILKPTGSTKTWATYSGDFYAGKAAVTFNQSGKGTVTYIGTDSYNGDLEPFVLTKLYKHLQIPVENYPPGVIVEYRDGFGIALNYADKPYEMKLPRDAEIMIGETTLNTAGVLVWKLK